jgi:hypothetical protein
MTTSPITQFLSARRSPLITRFVLVLCTLLPVSRAADFASSTPRNVTIAVVKDGPSSLLDNVDAAFREEARLLTAGRATLNFKGGGAFDAGWSVLGALVQEGDLVPLPIASGGRSTKTNFAVVALTSRAVDQLTELRAAVPFTSLHVLIDEFFAPERSALSAWRDQLARALNVVVPVDSSLRSE